MYYVRESKHPNRCFSSLLLEPQNSFHHHFTLVKQNKSELSAIPFMYVPWCENNGFFDEGRDRGDN